MGTTWHWPDRDNIEDEIMRELRLMIRAGFLEELPGGLLRLTEKGQHASLEDLMEACRAVDDE
jgi:hypothetical protein